MSSAASIASATSQSQLHTRKLAFEVLARLYGAGA